MKLRRTKKNNISLANLKELISRLSYVTCRTKSYRCGVKTCLCISLVISQSYIFVIAKYIRIDLLAYATWHLNKKSF